MASKKTLSLDLSFSPLTVITPLDGRYNEKLEELRPFVSEYALIKTRTEIEILYLLALSKEAIVRKISTAEEKELLNIIDSFSLTDAQAVKQIEKETRHDVKAVERFLRGKLQATSMKNLTEMLHFGLTSEDINNLSYRLMLQRAMKNNILPTIIAVCTTFIDFADRWKSLPCIARTHGQPAVPTTLGKEIVVFADRLAKEIATLKKYSLTGKLNGAVGNFNALSYAFPKTNWISFSNNFITSLGLTPNMVTTQINTYEDVITLFQTIQKVNNILIDFDQDMWRYISDGWFTQEVRKGEIGSSAMPQKVNPIDFENSEGNLGMSNALCEFFTRKLGISRMQRDLTDSTVIRNIGTILGYALLGYKSIQTGLSRIAINEIKLKYDLEKDWAVLAEGAQTLLRKHGESDPYSLLLSLTRGKYVDEATWKQAIDSLTIDETIKRELKKLTPTSYIGLTEKIVSTALKDIKKKL